MNTLTAHAVISQISEEDLVLEPSPEFVINAQVQDIIDRAVTYLNVGYAVHFAGPAGTGKTTLAFHVASMRNRNTTIIQGDEDFGSSDMIGNDRGFRKSRVVDNYIHSVVKMQEETRSFWMDNRLTTACRNGDTLIYDEFSRSRPEANNVLLSVLSERILHLPKLQPNGESHIAVHPEFRAIFTSNPEEYAGVHRAQDALLDRMITIHLDHYDRQTEIEITMSQSGLAYSEVRGIVDLVLKLRQESELSGWPSIRSSIAIARIVAHLGIQPHSFDPRFKRICRDVLNISPSRSKRAGTNLCDQDLDALILQTCGL